MIDYQKKVATSAENLLHNMEEVLLWSKGQMENFKPVKKGILIGNLFKQIEAAFKDYDNVQLSFSDSENIAIVTDENYLFTIMKNLTANAVKALEGKANGLIQWKAAKQKDGKVTLSITDNGSGLTEAQRDGLLTGQEITGNKNGFGFHIVRDLAVAIQLLILAKSQPGIGTEFSLVFND
jgi:signal transduction histidine kinase